MEEELEVKALDEEIEVELGGDCLEELPIKPQTHLEEDNYEIGDKDIQ